MHNLVDGLLVAGQEIPESSCILRIGLWIALLGMYERGKLDTITNEEDLEIVSYVHLDLCQRKVLLPGVSFPTISQLPSSV